MINCIYVGIGGFIGSVCRYLIGQIPLHAGNGFPFKTLIINVIGAFLIGVLSSLSFKNLSLDPRHILLLKTGVCGGFTTFSTFALETTELIQNNQPILAAIYMISSMTLGVLAVFAGEMIV